jgi:hypothetical protein
MMPEYVNSMIKHTKLQPHIFNKNHKTLIFASHRYADDFDGEEGEGDDDDVEDDGNEEEKEVEKEVVVARRPPSATHIRPPSAYKRPPSAGPYQPLSASATKNPRSTRAAAAAAPAPMDLFSPTHRRQSPKNATVPPPAPVRVGGSDEEDQV